MGSAEDGLLLRDYLKNRLHFSRKLLSGLKFREDGILVNGRRVTVRFKLSAGDVLALNTADEESENAPAPVELPLDILYEDPDIVLPNKPFDMPTHPSHGHYGDTVGNALAFRYRSQSSAPYIFRPVNRLDRNTSGVLLIARNQLAAGRLNAALRRGEIRKTYLAVLVGELPSGEGVIDKPLHRTAESIIVREVCSPDAPDADPARTEYRVLASRGGYSLVEAHPITGRTHQLRVHFASLGHPILGDDLYGSPSPLIPRQALHAYRLSFSHPADGHRMEVSAPLPADFDSVIRALFPEVIL